MARTNRTQKQTELRYLAHRMAAPVCDRGGASLVRDELDAQRNDDVSQAQAERDALAAIVAMPRREQSYLGIAHYWACRGPRAEYHDWRNELYLRMVVAGKPAALAWHECQCDCKNLWARYVRQGEFSAPFSAPGALDAEDPYVERTMGSIAESAAWTSDVADYVCDALDTAALWEQLNASPRLAAIVDKRLRSCALTGAERVYLHRWIDAHRDELAAATA